jgi:hypothetical protein
VRTGNEADAQAAGATPAEHGAPYDRLERAGRGAWWAVGLVVLAGVALYLLRRYGGWNAAASRACSVR